MITVRFSELSTAEAREVTTEVRPEVTMKVEKGICTISGRCVDGTLISCEGAVEPGTTMPCFYTYSVHNDVAHLGTLTCGDTKVSCGDNGSGSGGELPTEPTDPDPEPVNPSGSEGGTTPGTKQRGELL